MRAMNVPAPVNGSITLTPLSVNPLPKFSRSTQSTDRSMKSTTSVGVYTIPSRSAIFGNAFLKNVPYNSDMTRWWASWESKPEIRLSMEW